MTNYQSAIKRIDQADTIEKLESLEKSFNRIYSAGFLTDSELTRLDHKICTRLHFMNLDNIPTSNIIDINID